MGNVLGVALGGFLMTTAFEAHTGLPGISLSTDQPVGFVAALNTTFLTAVGFTRDVNRKRQQSLIKGLKNRRAV